MPGRKQAVLNNFLLTCEHGGNEIPAFLKDLIAIPPAVLRSHRGWDPGALKLFRAMLPLADFALSSTTSRLVVELNRSPKHRRLFSEYSGYLSEEVKKRILEGIYQPYRSQAENWVKAQLASGEKVTHISVHTFTPVLRGVRRNASLGLLYDPSRKGEVALCKSIAGILRERRPSLLVRMNYPYKGRSDGFTTYLRNKYRSYSGIEIEVNQKLLAGDRFEAGLTKDIVLAISQSLDRT